MNYPNEDFFAPCPRGLEAVLSGELQSLGAHHIRATHGGVGFRGPFHLCYQVNLRSRLASRVLWQVFHGSYRNEADIFRAAFSLPWATWFRVDQAIKVKVSAQGCPLKSLDFITLRIKDAVCDAFMKIRGIRPHVDTKVPDIQIHAFLDESHLILYLDTSGEPLFKRGWRCAQGVAPIRENLAAGILHLAGWTEDQFLLDPMCGSGTILIEAGQMAKGVAPGIGRSFAFQKFSNYNIRLWKDLCRKSRDQQKENLAKRIYGCDWDPIAIRDARMNVQTVGLDKAITLQIEDALTITPPASSGILVTNPPYGVRVGEHSELEKFYPLLGDLLKQKFVGWSAYIFTADARLQKLIRLSPSKRVPLFNGDLECRLYEFKLVKGEPQEKCQGRGGTWLNGMASLGFRLRWSTAGYAVLGIVVDETIERSF